MAEQHPDFLSAGAVTEWATATLMEWLPGKREHDKTKRLYRLSYMSTDVLVVESVVGYASPQLFTVRVHVQELE